MQALEKRSAKVKSAFWSFSQSIYAAKGVQKECLHLQDKFGIDVNLVLFCAFVGAVHGALLPTEELSNVSIAVGQWHEGVVRPLRTIRRALKQGGPPHSVGAASIDSFRKSIKSVELEAERLEQLALEAWCQSRVDSWPRAERNTAVTANIRALFALRGTLAQQIALPANMIAASANVQTPNDD